MALLAGCWLWLVLSPVTAGAQSVPDLGRRPPLSRTELLAGLESGMDRDAAGLISVFGLPPEVAAEAFLAATKDEPLPSGYAPRDLVYAAGAQPIRRLILADTLALLQAAAEEGFGLNITSGYRSAGYQADVFAAQVARRGDAELANRWSARPGYSQHQLGTTIDFGASTGQFGRFGGSAEGQWLVAHASEFGFVFPYTDRNQERTGYVPEPWHVRWVGRPLAAWMANAGYLEWSDPTADDVIAAARQVAGL